MIYRYYIVLYSPERGYVSNYSAAQTQKEYLQFTNEVSKASFWDGYGDSEPYCRWLDATAQGVRVYQKDVEWHSIRKTDNNVTDEDLEAKRTEVPEWDSWKTL